MRDRRLAMASLDPDAAIAAISSSSVEAVWQAPTTELALAPAVDSRPVLVVDAEIPQQFSRWRFFFFWMLIKLACRVYPFKFEIHRAGGE